MKRIIIRALHGFVTGIPRITGDPSKVVLEPNEICWFDEISAKPGSCWEVVQGPCYWDLQLQYFTEDPSNKSVKASTVQPVAGEKKQSR